MNKNQETNGVLIDVADVINLTQDILESWILKVLNILYVGILIKELT
jgi:hypothetical protein